MKDVLLSFSFLLLFTIVVFSSRQEQQQFFQDSFLYLKKQQLQWQFYSKAQNKLFRKAHPIKGKTIDERDQERSKEDISTNKSPRSLLLVDNEASKINLAFLADPNLYPEAKEKIALLLLRLYGAAPQRPAIIKSKEEAIALLEEIGREIQKIDGNDRTTTRLRDLNLSQYRDLFYRLLQGTCKYDLDRNLGVMPLESLFTCFCKGKKYVLYAKQSSQTSLALIFSKEFVTKLLSEESKVKSKRLKSDEFRALIQKEIDHHLATEAVVWTAFTSLLPNSFHDTERDESTGLKMEGPPFGINEETAAQT